MTKPKVKPKKADKVKDSSSPGYAAEMKVGVQKMSLKFE